MGATVGRWGVFAVLVVSLLAAPVASASGLEEACRACFAARRGQGIGLIGDTADLLVLGIGAFDVAEERRELSAGPAAAGQFEYRLGRKMLFAGPVAGLMANTDGGVFGYGGLYFDLALDRSQRWRLSPLLTLGGYRQGHSKVLGGVFEFQVGGNLAYELESGSRLGFTAVHISNAFIHDDNPGAELFFLSYMIPLFVAP